MIVRARAPLRLGLAGGGTDLPKFSGMYGGCVLNATIDRYVHVTLEEVSPDKVIFASGDLDKIDILEPASAYPLDAGLILHRAVYNYFIAKCNDSRPLSLSVHSYAEAPAGSGLGTSSTVVVALCAAFAEYFKLTLDEYNLAHLAWKIEREICGLAGGKQDQYTATFGGVNFMEFRPSGSVLVNPLRVKKWILSEFESSLLLYFTGISRDSDTIIKKQDYNIERASEAALRASLDVKQEAYDMKASLLTGDFPNLIESFRRGWESKKKMAPEISNSHIEDVYERAMQAGAMAAKISGAGGGGFMMFVVPPHRRKAVMDVLLELGGEMFPAHFTHTGVEVWRR